ncbi:MAG: hypothetical protein IPJ04_03330 [Candidatus Eisenbacteria bacterium]|nr:hypothetical protein [Candidatus Eisenbacteria bacterium]
MSSAARVLASLLLALTVTTASAETPVFLERWGGLVSGSGPREFDTPSSCALGPNGHLYVTEYGNARVQELTANGEFVRFIDVPDDASGRRAYPDHLVIDGEGHVYLTTRAPSSRIQKYSSDGRLLTWWTSSGVRIDTGNFAPAAMTVDREGNLLVAEYYSQQILRFSPTGTLLSQWSAAPLEGDFANYEGMAVDAHGAVYVTDSFRQKMSKYTADGRLLARWGGPGYAGTRFGGIGRVLYLGNGTLLVMDAGNQRIAWVDTLGTIVGQIGGVPPGARDVFDPTDAVIDRTGRVLAVERVRHSVMVFGPRPDSAPIADAGRDITVECGAPSGTPVRLDGSNSRDPDGESFVWRWSAPGVTFDDPASPTPTGTFPYGTTLVTLTVLDTALTSVDTVRVTVADTAPPALAVTLDPNVLWPPNGHMIPIHATVTASDACGGPVSVALATITNSECRPVLADDRNRRGGGEDGDDHGEHGDHDGEGEDHGHDDDRDRCEGFVRGASFGTADFDFELRAERRGHGAGRTYTVCYEAVDAAGHRARACAEVFVPRDHREGDRLRGARELRFSAEARPNPARGGVEIAFELPRAGHTRLSVYDVAGRLVATPVDEVRSAGAHSVRFTPNRGSGGAQLLLYRLTQGDDVRTGRVLLLP